MYALLLYVNVSHLICAFHTSDQFEVLTLGAGYHPPQPPQSKKREEKRIVSHSSEHLLLLVAPQEDLMTLIGDILV